jgi:PPK2 family polyphosphate:nucleotide phosphotransferase
VAREQVRLTAAASTGGIHLTRMMPVPRGLDTLAGHGSRDPGRAPSGPRWPDRTSQEVGAVVEVTKARRKRIETFIEPLRVRPGSTVHLGRDFDPGMRYEITRKKDGRELLQTGIELLAEYQTKLAAEQSHAVLVCLQSLDAGGKDGTIRHVFTGVNPQGVQVNGFKVPSAAELDHDYLWRYARKLPARGQIGIFNRSHYEEVLVVRVHPEALARQKLPDRGEDGDLWDRRYREINNWEQYLVDNGTKVVKLCLNLSKEEQRIRFLKRLDVPERNWKFSAADARERRRWDDYQDAFSRMLSATSTEHAPWYVIPADHKWFARICAGAVLAQTLIDIDPQFPVVDVDTVRALGAARQELEAEAPEGAAPDPFAAAHDVAGQTDGHGHGHGHGHGRSDGNGRARTKRAPARTR